jgi:Flp pilus assembly protein TadG
MIAFSHHAGRPAPSPAPDPATTRACRSRRSRGATILEAAFAIPIFLTMLLGFIDLGLGVFQTAQATSAAADGARTGIVNQTNADVVGSPARLAIEASVRARLVGQTVDAITVECVDETAVVVTCQNADPETDRLKVTVKWRFRPISLVGNALPVQDITGSATMGLVRQPVVAATSTTLPPDP